MSKDVFDATYNEQTVKAKKLNTKEGLRQEFPEDILTESEISSIAKLANIAGIWKGPYFPMSRFGKYVVHAERIRETKQFASKKEATEFRARMAAADPTLELSTTNQDDGTVTVAVKEVEFRITETQTEALTARTEMAAMYGDKNVSPVQLKDTLVSRDSAISSDQGLSTLLNKLGDNDAAKAAIKDFYLRSLADGSFRKHERAARIVAV
ncbi:MAG: hypothetical protein HC793_00140 [Aquincola sp.]|nr:hypothetical protein [Aquincola sp.]